MITEGSEMISNRSTVRHISNVILQRIINLTLHRRVRQTG